jgi:hypothetical protein
VRVRSAGSSIADQVRGSGGGFAARLAADPEAVARLSQRYGLEMRPDTVPDLLERFGLQLGHPIAGGWRP